MYTKPLQLQGFCFIKSFKGLLSLLMGYGPIVEKYEVNLKVLIMKASLIMLRVKYLIALLVFTFIQTMVWAQTETTESSSSTTKVTVTEETAGSEWYTNPIVWVVGAAVFILLLVALLRGGGDRTDRVTYKEKIVRDRDTDTGRV